MPVVAADLIVYGSANLPENDVDTSGGGIDRTIKILSVDMQDEGGSDTLEVLSDDASDALTVTVTGRLSTGVVTSEAFTVAGTTPQSGAVTFERILKIVTSGVSAHVGTVTVREASGNQTIATLEGTGTSPFGVAIAEVRRPFYGATAESTQKELYEKVFIANTNASLALLDATCELTVDSTANNLVDFDLESATSGTQSVTNRLTAPTGLLKGSWDDLISDVPPSGSGNLGPISGEAEHIGVWLRLTLPSGEAPENTSITLQVSGTTT